MPILPSPQRQPLPLPTCKPPPTTTPPLPQAKLPFIHSASDVGGDFEKWQGNLGNTLGDINEVQHIYTKVQDS